MDLVPARRLLRTARLWLQAGEPSMADAVAAFYRRNRRHFAPWDPPTPEDFCTSRTQLQRLEAAEAAFANGSAFRYWLCLPDEPDEVIGSVHFSQVARGAFHNAMLGYALDEAAQGQGLMHEALVALVAEVFSPRVNLHRLQAAYRPENLRSARLLERLGFEREGLARGYLFIAGAWRDHALCALRNPAFVAPADWLNGSRANP